EPQALRRPGRRAAAHARCDRGERKRGRRIGAAGLSRRLEQGPRRRARHPRGSDGKNVRDRGGAARDRSRRAAPRRPRHHQGRQGRRALTRDPGAAHLRGRDRSAEGGHRPRAVEEPGGKIGARGGVARSGGRAGSVANDGFWRGATAMTAHLDTFARDNLPPRAQWPNFLFELPELKYPERMNCVVELLDRSLAASRGNRPCLISPAETWTYAQLAERVNRIANVLTRMLGVVPGHRVLLRGPNSPMMVAAYLAVIKAGAVVVATMPLLRAQEIAYPIAKAKIRLALCDHRLAEEMEKARAVAGDLERVVYWGSGAADALEALMATPGYETFVPCDTASDDVCLIGFTSGTTGEPKGTRHFHRDMLATC